MKKEAIKLEVGDKVCWHSQAGGWGLEKRGTVFYIIPAGMKPLFKMAENVNLASFNTHSIDPRSLPRTEDSYVVEVASKGKAKPRLYWPIPHKLQKA